MVAIRRMNFDDLHIVTEIERLLWPNYPWTADDFINSGCNCYVLLEDGFIVGYSVFYVNNKVSFIANISIRPDKQRQGFGRLMLSYLVNKARKSRSNKIELEVDVANNRAIRLYESFGFQIMNNHHQYYARTQGDSFKMQLRL
ncbi:unnamed protein product [Didymodactylos carnosus]|uniref:N-acetyltransferase domain-containing protein n=1 Tax=Didymodactylos carnosus TaxID=1234261 RepID=A0A814VZ33_9BILA|nr:unnamed protein product [Didymodactylos carnosus]CAF1194953.1 unnamed protein product [Didymodactylos carnosus]CAF3635042.1 unnamed protein product [Didymodactylos carnosus]CAF3959362.1 unnamed protein product [Didymodactylos carnosus]